MVSYIEEEKDKQTRLLPSFKSSKGDIMKIREMNKESYTFTQSKAFEEFDDDMYDWDPVYNLDWEEVLDLLATVDDPVKGSTWEGTLARSKMQSLQWFLSWGY